MKKYCAASKYFSTLPLPSFSGYCWEYLTIFSRRQTSGFRLLDLFPTPLPAELVCLSGWRLTLRHSSPGVGEGRVMSERAFAPSLFWQVSWEDSTLIPLHCFLHLCTNWFSLPPPLRLTVQRCLWMFKSFSDYYFFISSIEVGNDGT